MSSMPQSRALVLVQTCWARQSLARWPLVPLPQTLPAVVTFSDGASLRCAYATHGRLALVRVHERRGLQIGCRNRHTQGCSGRTRGPCQDRRRLDARIRCAARRRRAVSGGGGLHGRRRLSRPDQEEREPLRAERILLRGAGPLLPGWRRSLV